MSCSFIADSERATWSETAVLSWVGTYWTSTYLSSITDRMYRYCTEMFFEASVSFACFSLPILPYCHKKSSEVRVCRFSCLSPLPWFTLYFPLQPQNALRIPLPGLIGTRLTSLWISSTLHYPKRWKQILFWTYDFPNPEKTESDKSKIPTSPFG